MRKESMIKDRLDDDDRGYDPSQIQRVCFACGSPQLILAKLLGSEGVNYVSKNRMGVCSNPSCHRYQDIAQLTTWTRV